MSRKAPAKAATAYIVVRALPSEDTSFTEPDRVFVDRTAARKHADELNRQLRALVNPFDTGSGFIKGGDKSLLALLKRLKLPQPKKKANYGYSYLDWAAWWDRYYFDMTHEQREAIWNALDRFNWYHVREVEME